MWDGDDSSQLNGKIKFIFQTTNQVAVEMNPGQFSQRMVAKLKLLPQFYHVELSISTWASLAGVWSAMKKGYNLKGQWSQSPNENGLFQHTWIYMDFSQLCHKLKWKINVAEQIWTWINLSHQTARMWPINMGTQQNLGWSEARMELTSQQLVLTLHVYNKHPFVIIIKAIINYMGPPVKQWIIYRSSMNETWWFTAAMSNHQKPTPLWQWLIGWQIFLFLMVIPNTVHKSNVFDG